VSAAWRTAGVVRVRAASTTSTSAGAPRAIGATAVRSAARSSSAVVALATAANRLGSPVEA
jgi:hypothetical protein